VLHIRKLVKNIVEGWLYVQLSDNRVLRKVPMYARQSWRGLTTDILRTYQEARIAGDADGMNRAFKMLMEAPVKYLSVTRGGNGGTRLRNAMLSRLSLGLKALREGEDTDDIHSIHPDIVNHQTPQHTELDRSAAVASFLLRDVVVLSGRSSKLLVLQKK